MAARERELFRELGACQSQIPILAELHRKMVRKGEEIQEASPRLHSSNSLRLRRPIRPHRRSALPKPSFEVSAKARRVPSIPSFFERPRDPLHVLLCFREGWDSAVFLDRLRPGVVSRERQRQISSKAVEHFPQIARAGFDAVF